MTRTIRITEQQAREIAKRINEGVEGINLNTKNFDNMNIQKAAQVAKGVATQNTSANVTLNGEQVRNDSDVNQVSNNIVSNAKDVADGSLFEGKKCITKKQIKDSKLKKLRESSVSCNKKDLLKKF